MPIRYVLRPDARAAIAVGTDPVAGGDFVKACERILLHPDWRPGFGEVWDASATTDVHISPDDLATLVRTVRRNQAALGEGRVAIVVSGWAQATLVRLFGTLVTGTRREYRPVRTLAEAAEWVGLDADALAAAVRGVDTA